MGLLPTNAGRRVSEISVRMALGAGRSHIVRLVLQGAFGLILFGLYWVADDVCRGAILNSQLYGINPYNPW